jgi:hypothetical protein
MWPCCWEWLWSPPVGEEGGAAVDTFLDSLNHEDQMNQLLDFFSHQPVPTHPNESIRHVIMVDGENMVGLAAHIPCPSDTHVVMYGAEGHRMWRAAWPNHLITQKTPRGRDACDVFMIMDFCELRNMYPNLKLVSVYTNDHFAKALSQAAGYMDMGIKVMHCTIKGKLGRNASRVIAKYNSAARAILKS